MRKEILEKAIQCVCTDRNGTYGEPEDNFKVIAELWNTYLSFVLTGGQMLEAKDVAAMMILFKIARTVTAQVPAPDTWVDIAGYAACGAGVENK